MPDTQSATKNPSACIAGGQRFCGRSAVMRPSLYDFCAGHDQAHLLAQWDDERNAPLTPKDVTYGSHQKVWWRCSQGHSYRSEVRIRTRGTGCPICAGRTVLPEETSLAAKFPDLLSEWDTEKNSPLLPTQVMPGAHRKVWWRCPKGHSWQASVASRVTSNAGCPF